MRTFTAIELRKIVIGRATLLTLFVGVVLCLLGAYGSVVSAEQGAPADLHDGTVTASMVQAWMMMLLFAAIVGALGVTREIGALTLGRTVLAFGGRTQAFVAKATAALLTGLATGILTAALSAATTVLLLRTVGVELRWTEQATWTLVGVAASVLLATLWGHVLGWLIRAQTVTVLAIVLLVVVLEPAIQRLVPDAARYLFTIALSSIYRDDKPELLAVWPATAVALAWVAALAVAAHHMLRRRDLP